MRVAMRTRRFALVVAQFPLPFPTPLGEDYFAEPARMMAEADFEVEILTVRHDRQPETETDADLRIRRFRTKKLLLDAMWAGRYDLVHAHSHFRPALLAGWMLRWSKTVFTSHSYALPRSALKRRVLIALMNRFDRVIALTPFERDAYITAGIPASKVVVVPHGINVGFFSSGGDASRFRAQWQLQTDAPVILFVGNLRPVKNPDVVVRAFHRVRTQLPAAQLVFAGENLLPESGPGGEGIVHTGWLDAEWLRDALAAATVVVNSSSHEGFPLSVFEAAAASRPFCLPAVGSLQSVIGDNALYHEPTDDATLAANILRYLREPELRRVHITVNRQLVEKFDSPRALEQLRMVYRSLLER
jgi:glycosyltransferase involved in cell wall biosynthesis